MFQPRGSHRPNSPTLLSDRRPRGSNVLLRYGNDAILIQPPG